MFENIPFITRADKIDSVGLVQELCGDEFAHGQNQVLRSFADLEARLRFTSDKTPAKPQCFVVKVKGFWADEYSVKDAPAQDAVIPVYIYALTSGASYKVAYSSRFIPSYKSAGYYTEIANGPSAEKQSGGLLLRRSSYSSDLLSILRHLQASVGLEVFEVL